MTLTDAAVAGEPWLLSLLRFTSPTLPIGAYAYSRGLEQAVHAGDVHDEASARAWIVGLLQHTAARLDGAILWRLLAAFAQGERAVVESWNARLLASRESAELRLEDTQLGAALARLLAGQGVAAAQAFMSRADVCYATLFALAAISFNIPAPAAVQGFLWAQAESQCSAAVRLDPAGANRRAAAARRVRRSRARVRRTRAPPSRRRHRRARTRPRARERAARDAIHPALSIMRQVT